MNVIEANGLGKRYGSTWALRDCSLAIPAGHVVALVGPNGAGKSTLLTLAVGLVAPSAGDIAVLGGRPPGSPAALDGIAFVAQDTPLYRNLSAGDMLHLTRNLNRHFDQASAEARLAELGIPLQRKAGKMSGGQQSQLALTLALARKPRLLVLDEPMAMLDPIARHDFMATVLTAAVDDDVSVVLSSHVLAELERVADYLIMVSQGRVQMAGEVDDLLANHRVLTGPAAEADRYTGTPVVHVRRGEAQAHLLVRATVDDPVPPGWDSHPVGLEELALGLPARTWCHRAPRPHPRAGRRTVGDVAMTALAVPVRPDQDASLRPVPWPRMVWVTWRQHRFALGGAAVFLGALAVYVWTAGLQLHHAYATATTCNPTSAACGDLIQRLDTDFNFANHLLVGGYVLQIVPALIGAFVGAPVLARELETGTFRYAWTQGFGRWRWTLAKLVLLAVAVTAAAGAISVLFSWYYQPYLATGNPARSLPELSPFSPPLFDLRGVTFAVWTLTAFAIGVLAGVIIRRVVPAIVATLAAYTGLALVAANLLRPHYMTPLLSRGTNVPGSAWTFSQWWAKGGKFAFSSWRDAPASLLRQCASIPKGPLGKPSSTTLSSCFSQHGYTQLTRYQPAGRFWAFQWIESSWLLALSAVLIAVTVWMVRRHAA